MGGCAAAFVDLFRGEEAAVADFFGLEVEGALVAAAVDLDELVSGFAAGVDFEEGLEVAGGDGDAEFFAEFADGGGGVVFSPVEVAATGGVPAIGVHIFPGGAALEEDFSLDVL